MRNCQGGPQKVARNSIEQSFNKVRKRCNSNDLNSMFEIVAGELRAKLGAVSAMPQVRSGHDTCAAARPGRASRRRAQPPISHHAPLLWRVPEGPEGTGGLRDRPLRAKLACSDLAGGRTRRRPQHQRHHKQTRGSPTGAKDQAGCWWAASGPGRALRRRAEPHVSDRPPQVWRVPEGPEGTGGLRDRPLRAKLACGDLAGGRARRRPQPSGTTSNTRRKAAAHRHTQRFGPQNKTRGSPSGPPRVHATSSYSTRSRGRAFSAVAGPRPRRPGPRSGQRPCAGCRRRRPG